jgi:methyl-accepting chemotaxis protein
MFRETEMMNFNSLIKYSEEIESILKTIEKDINKSLKQSTLEAQEIVSIASMLNIVSILIAIIFSIFTATYLSNKISKSLEEFQKGLLSFFDFLNKKSLTVDLLNEDAEKEISAMARVVNKNIEYTQNLIIEDEKLIEDVKTVVNHIKNGDLSNRIKVNTENKSLNELKVIINEMLDVTSKNVDSNINNILSTLDNFNNYNFTQDIPHSDGKVSKGINRLSEIINQMLLENKTDGIQLNNSATTLFADVEILNKASKEQVISLEQISELLSDITHTIEENMKNVNEMSKFANYVTKSVNDGQVLATRTNSAMDDINTQINSIADAVLIIDQIAFQTNILSLNAAVEAATAGEAGKGFAVVAGEVRNLAGRSAEAAKDIQNLVEVANQTANDGNAIADNMASGYKKLNDNIQDTLNLITGIEKSSSSQKDGIGQINSAISILHDKTADTLEIANKTKQIATDTLDMAKKIVDTADDKEFKGK